MGTGATPSLWGHLPDLNVPALVMAGELDERFVALARSMAASLPEAHLSIVPDTGHSVPVESPERLVSAMVDYFHRTER